MSKTSGRSGRYELPFAQRIMLAFSRPLRRGFRMFKYFPPGSYQSILDVGAYQGSFTDLALKYFDPARIWLVEADPMAAEALARKYDAEPRCKVVGAAIAETSGRVSFRVNQHRPSSSLLPINQIAGATFQQDMREVAVVTVPALSLDDLFAQEKINSVDLMKVDVQGAERYVIRGGGKALRHIHLIYIEVLFEEFYQDCALFSELDASLRASGFRLQLMNDFRQDHEGYLAYANALYAQKSPA